MKRYIQNKLDVVNRIHQKKRTFQLALKLVSNIPYIDALKTGSRALHCYINMTLWQRHVYWVLFVLYVWFDYILLFVCRIGGSKPLGWHVQNEHTSAPKQQNNKYCQWQLNYHGLPGILFHSIICFVIVLTHYIPFLPFVSSHATENFSSQAMDW